MSPSSFFKFFVLLLFLTVSVHAQKDQNSEFDEESFGEDEEWNTDEFGDEPEFDDNSFGNESEFSDESFGDESEFEDESFEKEFSDDGTISKAKKGSTTEDEEEDFDEEFSDEGDDVEPSEKPRIIITELDFKQFTAISRILIKANAPMDYDQEVDEERKQSIIIVKGAGIIPKLRRRLDTSEFKSSVRMIGAYPVTKPYPGVRIVVQLRYNVPATIKTEGNLMHIDYPSDELRDQTAGVGRSGEELLAKKRPMYLSEDEPIGGTFQDLLQGPEKYYGKPIGTLEVVDEEIRNVLAIISAHSGYNIVAGDDVDGKVTLHLKNIPWDQALNIVLKTKKLGYVRTGNVLRVAPLQTFREEKEAAARALEATQRLEPLQTLLLPVSYGSAREMEGHLRDFLSPRGTVKTNTKTNTLIVRDTDEHLRRVQKLVKTLDTESPQVVIESRLVEASKTFSRTIGMKGWNVFGSSSTGFSGGQFGDGEDVTELNVPGTGKGVGGVVQFVQGDTEQGMLFTIGAKPLSTLALSATLALLEQDNVVKTITSPRVVTLDNQTASILDGKKEVVIIPGTAGAPPIDVTLESKTTFNVTPHITSEGSIFLDIDVQRQFTVPVSSSTEVPDQFTRTAKTSVLVQNGETAVIGGFYNTQASLSESGTPWLRHIPLLGFLFRNRVTRDERTELVFFITPRILNVQKAFLRN